MSSKPVPNRFPRSVTRALTQCSSEVAVYGSCIKKSLPDIEQGMCEQQFAALKKCFRTQLKQSLKALK